jgi:uncharacterized protein (UPF0332 family)
MSEPEQPTNDAPIAGEALFADMTQRFVLPNVERRRKEGSWDESEVYRFQVLFPGGRAPEVRLNRDVGGSVMAKSTRAIAAGEETVVDDFSAVTSYTPREEDAGIPHVSGFLHRDGWSLIFEFSAGHPDRLEFLRRAEEFLETAQHALAEGRLGPFFDNALSACELFAKTELLSCQPTIEIVLNSRTHNAISTPYNLWANLGNTDKRYASLLGRLHERRSTARYLHRSNSLTSTEATETLELLTEMHAHVKACAEGSSARDSFTVYATRELRAGQLIMSGDFTLVPPRQSGSDPNAAGA